MLVRISNRVFSIRTGVFSYPNPTVVNDLLLFRIHHFAALGKRLLNLGHVPCVLVQQILDTSIENVIHFRSGFSFCDLLICQTGTGLCVLPLALLNKFDGVVIYSCVFLRLDILRGAGGLQ